MGDAICSECKYDEYNDDENVAIDYDQYQSSSDNSKDKDDNEYSPGSDSTTAN